MIYESLKKISDIMYLTKFERNIQVKLKVLAYFILKLSTSKYKHGKF